MKVKNWTLSKKMMIYGSVLRQLLSILNYTNTRKAIRDHVAPEDKCSLKSNPRGTNRSL